MADEARSDPMLIQVEAAVADRLREQARRELQGSHLAAGGRGQALTKPVGGFPAL